MKAVLMSIKPYWVFLIIAKAMGWNIGKEKTIEVRKSYPKDENWDKVVKIYCSKDRKSFAKIPKEYQPLMQQFLNKVIGEFVCDVIYKYTADPFICDDIKEQCTISDDDMVKQSCLTLDELYHYEKYPESYNWGLLGWHISDLVIYDKPKELNGFCTIDNEAVKQCEHRERIYNNPDYTNGALLLGSYVCNKGEIDWCTKCKTKPITKPPQSWCYVEELR